MVNTSEYVDIDRDLTPLEIAARLEAMQSQLPATEHTVTESTVVTPADIRRAVIDQQFAMLADQQKQYRFVRPLLSAADSLIEVFQNTDGRIMFGLKEIDTWMRGIGRSELCYVTGFAHSGKTQLFLLMVLTNRRRNIVLFTFDEPAELVLTKLVCMRLGWNAEVLEQRIKDKDQDAIDAVRRVASADFPNLLVIDEPLTLAQMSDAMKEARRYFDGPVEAVGVDYLELLRCDESEVEKKSQELKRWVKEQEVAVICLHQGSRGNAGKGQKLTMQSMKYGGEAEATFVVGVRDLSQDSDLDEWQQQSLRGHVEISLLKNKRPPSRKGAHTYFMEQATGLLRALRPTDHGSTDQPMTSSEAMARRREIVGQQSLTEPDPERF